MITIDKSNESIEILTEYIPHANSYALGFWFDAGSRDEKKENNGISHFIEHMLFKGTSKRNAKRISLETEKHGAYLNAFTSKENTCFYARGIDGSFEKTFEILSDMITDPLFDEKEIRKEANVITDELCDILDTPEEFIFDEFEKIIYEKNSLSMPVIGNKENIAKFKRGDFMRHYGDYYLSSKLFIVAVGNIRPEKSAELTEKFLRVKFRKKNKRKKRKHVSENTSTFTTLYRPVSQYYSIIGRRATGFTSDDYLRLRLLSIILGEGSSSRLFVKLREQKGIAYQINSFVNGYSDTSTFGVYFSTNPEQKAKASKTIYAEIKKSSRGDITKAELSKAKKILASNIVLGTEDLSNRMSRIANSYIYTGKVLTANDVKEKLVKISADEINDYAKELFSPEEFSQIEIMDGN